MTTTESNAIPLVLPDASALIARPNVTELQRNAIRRFPLPSLNLDLSTQGVTFDFYPALDVHATYVGRYANQYVFGFHHLHALVGRDGEFNCQELLNYRGRLENYLANKPPDRFVLPNIDRTGDGGYSIDFSRLTSETVITLDGPVFLGSPIEPANWGMWMLNGLTNARAFVSAGQAGRFLCYAPSSWQQKLLSFVGVDPNKLVQQEPWQTYFCPEIALHQYTMIDLVPDESSLALFRNIVGRCADKSKPATPTRIFVSRRSVTAHSGGSYRALRNEAELIVALERYGFVVVEPELLSFEEQVRVFSNARFIVGLGGAAMFNAVFASPGTNLISIESTAVFSLNHARLFASLELNYGFIFGEQDVSAGNYPHNPWTIDVKRAVEAISGFG